MVWKFEYTPFLTKKWGFIFPIEKSCIARLDPNPFLLRGQKVMLSIHLADLYQVEPKVLTQAVKRNIERFPRDFMFQLTWDEVPRLKSQFVTSNVISNKGSRSQFVTLKRGLNIKYPPYAFTEQGVAMLSSVLRSNRAIQVKISKRPSASENEHLTNTYNIHIIL